MPRPQLPLGSHGQIKTWQDEAVFVARTRFRDYDGVVRPVKRSGRSRAAAERALRAALVDRQAPVKATQVGPNSTVEAVAELWFLEVERMVEDGERSRGTLDTYRHVYRNHVAPALGSLRVREVTTPVVNRVLMVMKRESTAIARLARTIVAGIMRYAARHGAVTYNPVREVARIEGTPKRRPRALTAEERRQWLDAVESNDAARRWDLPDLTRLMLATGCRVGECLALGWTEVDLDAATADVCWRLVRRTGAGLLRLPSTKSGKRGDRVVPLRSGQWACCASVAR
jgi:integrase